MMSSYFACLTTFSLRNVHILCAMLVNPLTVSSDLGELQNFACNDLTKSY